MKIGELIEKLETLDRDKRIGILSDDFTEINIIETIGNVEGCEDVYCLKAGYDCEWIAEEVE